MSARARLVSPAGVVGASGARSGSLSVLHSSETDQWLTPDEFLAVVRRLGPIEYDPCGNPLSIVGARRQVLLPSCGLAARWPKRGLVFVNPPYGDQLAAWALRIMRHAAEGGEVVSLVPARVDTAWWRALGAEVWCAWAGRLRFLQTVEDWTAGEEKKAKAAAGKGKPRKVRPLPTLAAPGLVQGDAAPFPVAVVYHGPRVDRFVEVFREHGPIYRKVA